MRRGILAAAAAVIAFGLISASASAKPRWWPHEPAGSGSLTMANGGTVKPRGLRLKDETPALRDPRLLLYGLNIPATNGVIHTIDRVLVPAAP
jgi:hypothetical protein